MSALQAEKVKGSGAHQQSRAGAGSQHLLRRRTPLQQVRGDGRLRRSRAINALLRAGGAIAGHGIFENHLNSSKWFANVRVMFSTDATGKVTYFGMWAEEADKRRLMAHALELLRGAAADCTEKDVRNDELGQALAFIEGHLVRPALARRFRKALDVPDQMERAAAVRQAYEAIVRAV